MPSAAPNPNASPACPRPAASSATRVTAAKAAIHRSSLDSLVGMSAIRSGFTLLVLFQDAKNLQQPARQADNAEYHAEHGAGVQPAVNQPAQKISARDTGEENKA